VGCGEIFIRFGKYTPESCVAVPALQRSQGPLGNPAASPKGSTSARERCMEPLIGTARSTSHTTSHSSTSRLYPTTPTITDARDTEQISFLFGQKDAFEVLRCCRSRIKIPKPWPRAKRIHDIIHSPFYQLATCRPKSQFSQFRAAAKTTSRF
jgi:hypothetical protein